MKELVEIAFSQVNIVLTILMILLILYWLFTMISGVDFDLDVDVDIDVDVDADLDMDTDSNIEGGNLDFEDIANTEVNKEDIVGKRRKPLKWWQILLIYFNFVGLPFMFTFTCWIFIWWLCTTITTSLTYSYNSDIGFIFFLAAIIPSLLITKVFTTPFKSFFRNLNKDGDAPIDLIGRKGVIQSTISEDKMGSAEVVVEGNPMSIYVKSLNGEQINYNQEILIIKQSGDKNYYYAQSYDD
nr:OB-fold-containig protein [Aquimarina sp. MMG015]